MFASDGLQNHWQVTNVRPQKRCRLDPEDVGVNTACPSSFVACLPNPPKSPFSTHRVDRHDDHDGNYYKVCTALDEGPAFLPPRYRKQWNKRMEFTPRNDNTICDLPPPEGKATDVIDLTGDTDEESNDLVPEHRDTDKTEYSNSEADSESEDSSHEMIPVVPRPAEFDISAVPVDLEHLNTTARGVMNDVRASKREIVQDRVNLPRTRLPLSKGSVHRPPEGVHVVAIPKSAWNTARRILVPESLELPVVTVSMRADLQFFHRANKYRLSRYSLPNHDDYRHVVDATMISDTAIFAYGIGPTQISLSHLIEGHRPALVDLTVHPHVQTLDPNQRGATISCLSSYPSNRKAVRFLTGGYDKAIRLWSVDPNRSDCCTTEELLRTSTNPEALAFHRSRQSLLVATSKKLLEIDIHHLTRKPACIFVSNVIYQIHVQENMTILEVDSLDHQIHLYDSRKKSGFDRTSDCYFGRRAKTAKHSKGDTRGSLFARGYDDGSVCVWDLRNAKSPVLRKTYHQLGSVIHTTFLNTDLVCYGKSGLTFLDISATDSR